MERPSTRSRRGFRTLRRCLLPVLGLVAAALPAGAAAAAPLLYLPYPAGVAYAISQGPNGATGHNGTSDRYAVDFDMATGDPISASAPGTVFRAGDAGDGFGKAVYVNHGGDVCTQYAHLSRIDVGLGQAVGQAKVLGLAGATGAVSGDHLHWGRVRCDSIYVSVPSATAETGSSFPTGSRPVSQNAAVPTGPPLQEVFAFGRAPDLGSPAGIPLARPLVGMTPTPTGQGYWLVASDGGIFAYGDARYAGSTGALHLNQSIVGMAATPTGQGYWLVASDGGIFAYGDARFVGSAGGLHLNRPIVGMAATPTGQGYWLVASDGGIFAYGDAPFAGSTGALRLNRPVVAVAATPTGSGYWFVASDGGIFAFGDAGFLGSTGATPLVSPMVGMAASPAGDGYRLAAGDGGVFAFGGGAPFLGRPDPALLRSGRAVGIATGPAGGYWVAATR